MSTPRISTRQASATIEARAEFTTHGALRGTGLNTWQGMHASRGILPNPYREQFVAALPDRGVPYGTPGSIGQPGTICYVVFSYETPIAWYVIGQGWVRPEVRYSVTTSKHQGQCPRTTEPVEVSA